MPCESPGPLSLRVDVLSSLACSRLAKEGLTRALEILLHTQAWDFGVAWLGEDDYLRYAADCLSPHIEADAHRFQAFAAAIRRHAWPVAAGGRTRRSRHADGTGTASCPGRGGVWRHRTVQPHTARS